MAFAQCAHGGLLVGAITLDHFSQIAYASGSQPPVADADVIENQVAARDERHQCVVGSALGIALRYYILSWGDGTALFLRWGLPGRAWSVAADALQRPLRSRFRRRLTASVRCQRRRQNPGECCRISIDDRGGGHQR
jgi:hypothetical protein